MLSREALGRLVRETWVAWAREQPAPKGSWLAGWDELDDGQREVDMRIGEAVAAAVIADAEQLMSDVARKVMRDGLNQLTDEMMTGKLADLERNIRASERERIARAVADLIRGLP